MLALHLLASLSTPHTPEELQQIVEADYNLNHQGRDYAVEDVQRLLKAWVSRGKPLFCAPRVAFSLVEPEPRVLEFHSINGGSARDLSAGVNTLLKVAAGHYDVAVTFYDNSRVSALLKHSAFPADCKYIGQGEDRTFQATFNLKA